MGGDLRGADVSRGAYKSCILKWGMGMKSLSYEGMRRQKKGLIVLLLLVSAVSALCLMTVGLSVSVPDIPDVLSRFWQGGRLSSQEKILLYMRMPSVLMAIAAGAALSLSGCVMQSVTHNDLVSPFTLGVSAAAAFGASLCIISGNALLGSAAGLIGGAFLASAVCIFLVYGLSMRTGMSASSLVLTGIAMNYFFSALSATVQFFAQEYKLGEIIQWTFGTFSKANWTTVGAAFFVILLAGVLYFCIALPLDAMAGNDDEMVRSLGVHPGRIRLIAGLSAVVLTSTIISFTGVIGFVGLIAPHMARMLVGTEHRLLLPTAGGIGALLLLYADAVGRYILYPVSIPVGIVISFIGVPIFVHLIVAMRKRRG